MNLQKLFEIQRILDEKIVKEKDLEGQDLLDKKILALQVELGELANEWRGFKFWSEDQKARTYYKRDCRACKGFGFIVGEDDSCFYCNGTGYEKQKNPLLEEYVDCLHFILSIGNDIGITEEEIFNHDGRKKEINKTFVDLFVGTGVLLYRNQPVKANYAIIFNELLNLGEMLGFTWEEVEQAYYAKNKINHERQENGY